MDVAMCGSGTTRMNGRLSGRKHLGAVVQCQQPSPLTEQKEEAAGEECGGFLLSLCWEGGGRLQAGGSYREQKNTRENWVKDWVRSEAQTTARSGWLPLPTDFRDPPRSQ